MEALEGGTEGHNDQPMPEKMVHFAPSFFPVFKVMYEHPHSPIGYDHRIGTSLWSLLTLAMLN
jgi:hypothetical protein